jgi:hypothetical protein
MVKVPKENLASVEKISNKIYPVSGHNEVKAQVVKAKSSKVASASGVFHNALPKKVRRVAY